MWKKITMSVFLGQWLPNWKHHGTMAKFPICCSFPPLTPTHKAKLQCKHFTLTVASSHRHTCMQWISFWHGYLSNKAIRSPFQNVSAKPVLVFTSIPASLSGKVIILHMQLCLCCSLTPCVYWATKVCPVPMCCGQTGRRRISQCCVVGKTLNDVFGNFFYCVTHIHVYFTMTQWEILTS